MKLSVSITGDSAMKNMLADFTKATQRRVLERALKKSAEPIRTEAQSNAPVDSGELRRSIKTTIVRSNAGKSAFAQSMAAGASRDDAAGAARAANRAAAGQGASARVVVEADAPHAHFIEFGTVVRRAQPFMAPAARSKQAEVQTRVRTELHREIEATARRLAARGKRKAKA